MEITIGMVKRESDPKRELTPTLGERTKQYLIRKTEKVFGIAF